MPGTIRRRYDEAKLARGGLMRYCGRYFLAGMIPALFVSMSTANAAPTRQVFSGTVTEIVNLRNVATGVRVGDPISYTLVFDFKEPAQIDGAPASQLAPRSMPEVIVNARFADIVHGSFL